MKSKIVIASSKEWFFKNHTRNKFDDYDVIYIDNTDNLNIRKLRKISPEYIFFPHWSHILSKDIIEAFDCIIFHSAPLPEGRGGSPIQNLLIRNYEESPIYAIRADEFIDSGPIYTSRLLKLHGKLDDIFKRMTPLIEDMIIEIVDKNIRPTPQVGEPTYFKRLKNTDNEIDFQSEVKKIYDQIRMVDSDEYQKAYKILDGCRLEFFNPRHTSSGEIMAEVLIRKNEKKN